MKTLIALVILSVLASAVPAQTVKSGSHLEALKKNQHRNSLIEDFDRGLFPGKTLFLTQSDQKNRQKASLAGKQKLDSVVSEVFDLDENKWLLESKEEYIYDDKGKQILLAYYFRDSLDEEWIGYLKEESEYNSDGNQSLYVFYLWDEYDSQWMAFLKSEYIYETGQKKYDLDFMWDEDSNDWESYGVYTYEYFDGLLVSITHGGVDTNYDGEINELDQMKIRYFYDLQANLIREITYMYPDEDTGWLAINKSEYTYTSNNKIESETSFTTDGESPEWHPDYQAFFIYDSNGNRISETSSYWNYDINDWQVSDKWEYNFNTNGDLVSMALYYWDNESESLIANFKNEYTHDDSFSYEDLILPYDYPPEYFRHMIKTYNQYDFIDGDWIITTRGEIFYSDFNTSGISEITIQGITVFPNPASESVTFKGNFLPGKALVEFIDIKGVKVLQEVLSENGIVNIETLASGLYFYILSSENNSSSGKFVVR